MCYKEFSSIILTCSFWKVPQNWPLELEWAAIRHSWFQNHDLAALVIYLYHEPGTAKNKENKMWPCGCRIVTCRDHIIAWVLHSMLLWSCTHRTVTHPSCRCHVIALKRTNECVLILHPTDCWYRGCGKAGSPKHRIYEQNIHPFCFPLHLKELYTRQILTLTKFN